MQCSIVPMNMIPLHGYDLTSSHGCLNGNGDDLPENGMGTGKMQGRQFSFRYSPVSWSAWRRHGDLCHWVGPERYAPFLASYFKAMVEKAEFPVNSAAFHQPKTLVPILRNMARCDPGQRETNRKIFLQRIQTVPLCTAAFLFR